MSEPAVIGLGAALLALGGGLVGTWLGARLAREAAERQWLRDHQLDAYAEFMRECTDLVAVAVVVYHQDEGTTTAEDLTRLITKWGSFRSAADRVNLVGSKSIQEARADLSQCCLAIWEGASPDERKATARQFEALTVKDYSRLFDQFVALARNDLEKPRV